jgi:glutathione S-transferase
MPDASHPQVVTYTADLSICSQICRLAVQEHNLTNAEDVAVDIEYAMDNYEPWFARLQPTMTVPVMCYGDRVVGDSKDILYFLAERHADRGLYPKAARAEIDKFVEGFYARFMFIGIYTFGHLLQRSDGLKRFILHAKTDVTLAKLRTLLGDPELGDVARKKLAQMEHRDFSQLSDPGLLEKANAEVTGLVQMLEDRLLEGRSWVCGEAYTLADIVATALLARVHFIQQEALFTATVRAYWQRLQARPSFTAANVCATWESTEMSRQFETFVPPADG